MSTRDEYPAGVPCWVDTAQADPAQAARFYAALFGWELADMMPPGAAGQYLMARLHGRSAAAISSVPPGTPARPPAWNTYIRVESADAAAGRVRHAGGRVLTEPMDVFDSGRMAVCSDTEGAEFSVWEAGSFRGAQAVNEHGAVNFNNLLTDNLAEAGEFYGAVFGWELRDFGQPMWALPGYGDFLETIRPGTRAGMVAMGIDGGFEDVVATAMPRGAGPARWSVTFGIDDVDSAARRAPELSGSVVTAPADAPWIRSAELADPAGASFIASQFVGNGG